MAFKTHRRFCKIHICIFATLSDVVFFESKIMIFDNSNKLSRFIKTLTFLQVLSTTSETLLPLLIAKYPEKTL